MGALAVGTSPRSVLASRPQAAARGHRLARQAEAWLRDNLTEPVTIREMCAALHAPDARFGETPSGTLRRVLTR